MGQPAQRAFTHTLEDRRSGGLEHSASRPSAVTHYQHTHRMLQSRCENERLLQELERYKHRISSATRDYVSAYWRRGGLRMGMSGTT